jgi:hypothetical protein
VPSIRITRQLVDGRMFGLTLEGLDAAMRELRRGDTRRRCRGPDGPGIAHHP